MLETVILQLDRLSKQFPGTKAPVLRDISLELHQGELLSLLGASGCGKTTLLRLIAGFEQSQTGTITLSGQVVAGSGRWLPSERRDIGMVFQDYALFPHLTVAENIAFGLRKSRRKRSGYPKPEMRKMVLEAIAQVGLTGLEHRYPHELSGGQQQRVALARALAPQPALILLDEPLSNLDVQVRIRLRQEIREILKATGTAAVFVTHDQEEALSISDRIAVMNAGQIEQLDTPEALYQVPTTRFVAEFVTQANFLPAIPDGDRWKTSIGSFTLPQAMEASFRAAELMIRQADLQLQPDNASGIVIRDRQFLGREHRYLLITPEGQRLQAVSTVNPALEVGTRVRLVVNPLRVQLFEASAA
jgi:iron(III) transport system ATP-binding protein